MEFDIKMISDPKVYAVGRLPARTFFETEEGDAEGTLKSSRIVELDGEWKFSYSQNYAGAIKGFEKTDYDCHAWDDIKVPGHMQLQGYDIPHYANVPYPWDGKQNLKTGEVPVTFNPIGEYVKYFECPAIPENHTVRVYFGGIESGAAIWLNGTFIGYMEDSFDAGEFDITDAIEEGTNKLAIMVFKWTLGSWFEDQDFFRFSGIFRSSWIYTVPNQHIEDISVRTLLDDNYADATLKLNVKTSAKGKIRIVLTSAEGEEIINSVENIADTKQTIGDDNPLGKTIDAYITELEYAVTAPKLWSAEKPNLYVLKVETLDTDGNLIESVCQNVGFRRFEIKDGLMCINGKRIVFRGANRHEFCKETGRVVPYEYTLKDILTMKANNINAIRTSHYPNDQVLYDLCDKYGLYLIAENNMETHGTWAKNGIAEHKDWALPSDHMEYEEMLFDRVRSCYEIHKNHPAILIWSDGNESFGGDVIADMSDLFRKLDPDRVVHYEGIFNDRRRPDTSDIESQMYTSVAGVQKFLDEHPEKPMILCEYTHAMGNSCGGMHLYTDLTKTEPRYQGGFIWDYIDQSLDAVDRYGVEFQAYGGDFGDRPTEYNFSGNGIAYGDRTPSPKMQEVKFNYQPVDIIVDETKVKLINRNLFTNTSEYAAHVKVLKDGVAIASMPFETAVMPLDEAEYTLPIEKQTVPGEYTYIVSLCLVADCDYAKAGYEVAFGQYTFVVEDENAQPAAEKEYELIIGEEHRGVRGENFFVMASGGRGGIVSYVKDGREYLNIVPMPNFWRAPTDNDRGNLMPGRYSQWKIASMYLSSKKSGTFDVFIPTFEQTDKGYEVTYKYNLTTTPEANVEVKYLIHGDGTIDTTLSYDVVPELHDMPEFGMMFVLSADLDCVKWYGAGPEETYADRKRGGKLGIYSNHVIDNVAKYLRPQECGNKEEVRWAEVTDKDGHGIRFESLGAPMCFSALPWTPHEMELASHPNELPPIHHTVVRVSLAQMGIAGDDSWGARTLPQYLIETGDRMEFKFSWKAI